MTRATLIVGALLAALMAAPLSDGRAHSTIVGNAPLAHATLP